MCFVWISEQTAIISLHSINRLVFVTETECVYCAVRTESLTIILFNLSLQMLICALNILVSEPLRTYFLDAENLTDSAATLMSITN
jgi:hypothetical protein